MKKALLIIMTLALMLCMCFTVAATDVASPEISETETTVESAESTPVEDSESETTTPADDNSVMTATIVIVSVTVVIVGGIVVFYVLEKKGVLSKMNKK